MSSTQSGDETVVKLRLCLGALMSASAESDILQLGTEGDPVLRDGVATSCGCDSKMDKGSIVREY